MEIYGDPRYLVIEMLFHLCSLAAPYLQVLQPEAALPETELVHLLVVVTEGRVRDRCVANVHVHQLQQVRAHHLEWGRRRVFHSRQFKAKKCRSGIQGLEIQQLVPGQHHRTLGVLGRVLDRVAGVPVFSVF